MRRLLFVSNLFPDLNHPIRGLDNATLLHAMSGDWEIRVLSPQAVLPIIQKIDSQPREEDLAFNPRYVACPYVPKVGSWCNDWLMKQALKPAFDRVVCEFRPDAVLCSWLYPDGCAVSQLAKRHHLPVILITQGTDTHGYLKIPTRRRKIVSAIQNSAAVICRSANLAQRLQEAGAKKNKLHVIYNGVDTDIFQPRNGSATRRDLDLREDQPVLLFVGNYLPVKNPVFLIRAHAELNRRRAQSGEPLAKLVMVGDGPLRSVMENAIRDLGSADTVDLRSREAPAAIARWMNAANLLCLTSHNEGFPNVILEAMACGLKVVSTDVGGIHELISHPARGLLVETGDLESYVGALEDALGSWNTHQQIKKHSPVSDWSWKRTADNYKTVIHPAI